VQVVSCTVEPAAPHRIMASRTMPLIRSVLTPGLPADFTGYPELAGRGAGPQLILDFPAEDLVTRTRWRTLARTAGAEFRVVECGCSDRKLHRAG